MCGGDLPVDRILRDGDTFELGDRKLEVVLTRGHTRGHCAFFERETGLLFSGDMTQGYGLSSSSGKSVFAPLYDDVDDYVHGLERLRALPFTQAVPRAPPPDGPRPGARADRPQHRVHRRDGRGSWPTCSPAPTDR